MRVRGNWLIALMGAALALPAAGAPSKGGYGGNFRFAVIGHVFAPQNASQRAPRGDAPDEALARLALRETDRADPAFVVITGIKAGAESCSDKLYSERKNLLNDSDGPLIVSLAASDWSACSNAKGSSTAIERLNRLRELFYADDTSLGAHPLPMSRLSADARFRSYPENAHWQHGRVLFATINLPADNNHFLSGAGRNSEFEDRLVANRKWLHRLFTLAQRKQLDGVVLFSDGDVGVQKEQNALLTDRQDGFASTRRQIRGLAQRFSGQVLLIDAQGAASAAPDIAWRGNLGHFGVGAGWAEIRVAPARTPSRRPPSRRAPLFSVTSTEPQGEAPR
jgi:hypothetical protein